ncbi:MAG: ferredoxin III, nif-specific [Zoogloeaceae bacterium]|jgi:Nif-specific ferredoxin III|nr:ferredoxin III, nif-specific [Zoogloeaceae bacterium]
MSHITGLTFGGAVWTPEFVTAINQETCIGCGRCYKVCPRDVLDLIEKVTDEDDDDDGGDASVMSLKNLADCIGCGACNRVCPKKCYSYAPAVAA